MSSTAHVALESTQELINSIAPIERISRDLRPPIRRLRQGLTLIVEGGEIMDEWVHMAEISGIDCEDSNTQSD